MDDKAVEEKYKPFWHEEKPEEVKVETPIETKPEPVTKSFFDNPIKSIFTKDDDTPRVKNRKPRNNEIMRKAYKKTKVVETESSGGSGFMTIATAAIGIGIVVMVGYLVITNIMSVPGMEQELNSTMIGGVSASSMIMPGFALVAVGIIVLAAFGLLNVFKSGDAR